LSVSEAKGLKATGKYSTMDHTGRFGHFRTVGENDPKSGKMS
jgi:hypothetical protein